MNRLRVSETNKVKIRAERNGQKLISLFFGPICDIWYISLYFRFFISVCNIYILHTAQCCPMKQYILKGYEKN